MVYLCVGKVDMKETIDWRIVNNIYTGPLNSTLIVLCVIGSDL